MSSNHIQMEIDTDDFLDAPRSSQPPIQYPLTPFNPSNQPLDVQANHMTYSPGHPLENSKTVYPSIPEYGFSSKLLSAGKHKRF